MVALDSDSMWQTTEKKSETTLFRSSKKSGVVLFSCGTALDNPYVSNIYLSYVVVFIACCRYFIYFPFLGNEKDIKLMEHVSFVPVENHFFQGSSKEIHNIETHLYVIA